MNSLKNYSLVIPIYNEQDSIFPLFDEIKNTAAYALLNKVVFVDDASTDNSIERINELILDNYGKVILLKHQKNLGQSYCIKTAANYLNDLYMITIDGDMQNDPKDISKLIKAIENTSSSLVGGIRKNRNDSLSKIIASKISNKVRQFILKDDCEDTGCSLKIFKREEFNLFPFFNGIHRFLPALYKGYGFKTHFIEVTHRPRTKGRSKYNNFNRLFWTIKDLHRVYKHLKPKQK